MLTGLHHLHNIMRWAVLLFAVITLFTALRGMISKRDFTTSDKRPALYLLICCDIQLLLGLALYFMMGYQNNFSGGVMKEVMKAPAARYWTVEHSVGMLLAIILVHVGYAGIKGIRPYAAKFRRLFWCTFIALLVLVATAPWPYKQAGIAKPLFPGMTVGN